MPFCAVSQAFSDIMTWWRALLERVIAPGNHGPFQRSRQRKRTPIRHRQPQGPRTAPRTAPLHASHETRQTVPAGGESYHKKTTGWRLRWNVRWAQPRCFVRFTPDNPRWLCRECHGRKIRQDTELAMFLSACSLDWHGARRLLGQNRRWCSRFCCHAAWSLLRGRQARADGCSFQARDSRRCNALYNK